MGVRKRAGELYPAHHIWYAATASAYGTAMAISGRRTVNYDEAQALTVNGNAGSVSSEQRTPTWR